MTNEIPLTVLVRYRSLVPSIRAAFNYVYLSIYPSVYSASKRRSPAPIFRVVGGGNNSAIRGNTRGISLTSGPSPPTQRYGVESREFPFAPRIIIQGLVTPHPFIRRAAPCPGKAIDPYSFERDRILYSKLERNAVIIHPREPVY